MPPDHPAELCGHASGRQPRHRNGSLWLSESATCDHDPRGVGTRLHSQLHETGATEPWMSRTQDLRQMVLNFPGIRPYYHGYSYCTGFQRWCRLTGHAGRGDPSAVSLERRCVVVLAANVLLSNRAVYASAFESDKRIQLPDLCYCPRHRTRNACPLFWARISQDQLINAAAN